MSSADLPASEPELLARAAAIAGLTLAELADRERLACPAEPRRAKGFIGQLVERALIGRPPSSAPGPDLEQLGIELKTIPVARDGRPRESTFVCVANLSELCELAWEASPVRRKLARVLWIPVESEPSVAFERRRIGRAIAWSPSIEEEAVLAGDWDEIASRVGSDGAESVSAHVGVWLQLRPKAASARVLGRARDERGALVRAAPRGFYLRSELTAAIVRRG